MNQKDIQNKNCYRYGIGKENLGMPIDEPIDDKPNEKIMNAVRVLLKEIGEDPDREGLKRTPIRIARAYNEWFGGYGKSPKEVLNRTFPSEGYDDLVVIKDVKYVSWCEHHMAEFNGKVHIGLVYKDRVAGLDKFPKLVDIFAKRLQTQEVMTQQIGNAIKEVLSPKAVIVVIKGKHGCVGSRETKQDELEFVTTYRFGSFKEDNQLENRFLEYIK